MSAAVWSPAVIGVLRPRILLPTSASQWSDEALLASLAHERAHLERFDPGIRLLAQVTRAAYWMNPLVHLAERRLASERERACDDSIVRDGWNPLSYAELLVGLARQRKAHVCGALEMTGGTSWLAGRVERILSRSVARDRLGVPAAFGMLTMAFLVGSAMAWSSFVRVESPVPIAVHLEDLAEGTALERRYAAWALGEREDTRAISSLISALADSDARVRGVAAWALGEIKDPGSAAALSAAVDDPDPRVREMAVVALGELGASEGFEVVARAGEDDPLLRTPAEWALRQLHGDGQDVPWTMEPGAERVFLRADQGERASPDARVTPALPDLRSPDARVRAATALEMGRAGDPRAVEPLLDALEDPSPAVRAAAVWALDEINPSRR